jgi:hypothetical protein
MRADEMRTGQEYEMQRGETHRKRRVTLLAKDTPSGRSRYVLVRIEDGISAGKEKEVPSQSIRQLPGTKPTTRRKTRKRAAMMPKTEAPPGWVPFPGEVVTWTQTLSLPLTVLEVDTERGVALVKGKEVFGMEEQYEALVSELCPYAQKPQLVVLDSDVEERLGDRLPEKLGAKSELLESKSPRVETIEEDEDIVERLVFSPGCIAFYRRRFARGASAKRAEEHLRNELHGAEKIRKGHTREYLRLRVPGRCDVVLNKRPVQGDFASCYVAGLQLPAKPKCGARLRRPRAA